MLRQTTEQHLKKYLDISRKMKKNVEQECNILKVIRNIKLVLFFLP